MTKSRRVIWIARTIAIVADLLQIAIFPVTSEGIYSPVSDIIDGVTCFLLILLLGWHIAFLPSFLIKFLPFADLAPTWTIAVLLVTRGSAAEEPKQLDGPIEKH
jgi:hypothetical protein